MAISDGSVTTAKGRLDQQAGESATGYVSKADMQAAMDDLQDGWQVDVDTATGVQVVTWADGAWHHRGATIAARPAAAFADGQVVVWDTSLDVTVTDPPSLAAAGDRWIRHPAVTPGGTAPPEASTRDDRFHVMPSAATLQASPRKAWAHFMPTWPRSIDNKNGITDSTEYYTRVWMPPGATEGTTDHQDYGGFIRDRPTPRAPQSGSDAVSAWPTTSGGPYWQIQDMEDDVEDAYRMGLDGFFLLTQSPRSSTNDRQGKGPYWLLQACINHGQGMKCVLMPDMTTSFGSLSVADFCTEVAAQAAYSSAYRESGELVLAPYKAENQTVSWWNSVMAEMSSTHGETIRFWPSFNDINTYRSAFSAANNIVGMTTWGNAFATGNPVTADASNTNYPYGQGVSVLDLGLRWCQSVRLQDHRAHSQAYWEPEAGKNYRNTWEIARQLHTYNADADWVQITTWNDWAEQSSVCPALYNDRRKIEELTSYFLTWWKTGAAPDIRKDTVYLMHRIMPHGETVQSTDQTLFMTRYGGIANWQYLEATVFATAAADVTVTSGSNQTTTSVPAGMTVVAVPLGLGTQSATLTRGGQTAVTATSSDTVVTSPLVQDYLFRLHAAARSAGGVTANATAALAAAGNVTTP